MTTIYHNPRCSKSRQAIALLEKHKIDFKIVTYLQTPPSKKELKNILKKLDKKPIDVIRSKEKVLTELGLTLSELSDNKLIELMTEHPILLERPIVITDTDARLGRPPENILELFD